MPKATPRSIQLQLHRFGLERDRVRTALSHRAGVTPSELDALEHLEVGPLTQRELGDRLQLSSGGITFLVDRLERGGWVIRRPHPSDRRAVLLELNEKPTSDLPRALADYHAAIAAAARAIPPSSREAVAAFLDSATVEAASAVEALQAD